MFAGETATAPSGAAFAASGDGCAVHTIVSSYPRFIEHPARADGQYYGNDVWVLLGPKYKNVIERLNLESLSNECRSILKFSNACIGCKHATTFGNVRCFYEQLQKAVKLNKTKERRVRAFKVGEDIAASYAKKGDDETFYGPTNRVAHLVSALQKSPTLVKYVKPFWTAGFLGVSRDPHNCVRDPAYYAMNPATTKQATAPRLPGKALFQHVAAVKEAASARSRKSATTRKLYAVCKNNCSLEKHCWRTLAGHRWGIQYCAVRHDSHTIGEDGGFYTAEHLRSQFEIQYRQLRYRRSLAETSFIAHNAGAALRLQNHRMFVGPMLPDMHHVSFLHVTDRVRIVVPFEEARHLILSRADTRYHDWAARYPSRPTAASAMSYDDAVLYYTLCCLAWSKENYAPRGYYCGVNRAAYRVPLLSVLRFTPDAVPSSHGCYDDAYGTNERVPGMRTTLSNGKSYRETARMLFGFDDLLLASPNNDAADVEGAYACASKNVNSV